ncbi:MAG: hypothetical protein KKD44_26790, partial [Proteobacteria bacterium]|nr:hypothetical protein [Pseudomonadota bacterium]
MKKFKQPSIIPGLDFQSYIRKEILDAIYNPMKPLTEQEAKAQVLSVKLHNIMQKGIIHPTGRELINALNEAGYELKEKELKKEKTLFGYIHEYITCKYNAHEIHRILQYEILIRNETEKLKNVIKRLTFEQCCGILKMICEDKFHTHFWSFL